MRLKKGFLLFFLFSSLYSMGQQPRKIEGVVVSDQDQQPLSEVSILVKGSKPVIGTSTNMNGKFSISIPASVINPVLIFTSVNYAKQEVSIRSDKPLRIFMKSVSHQMDEVVVIGYGTALKKDLTGSVSRVNMEDMKKAPVRSFEEALAGRVAGVQVSSGDGQPGAGYNIVIRGGNSLTQDNSPLYVIDGFPQENPDNNVLNPSEIESIDVLKDASATAIYGARGANGVIIITTKRGKAGAPVVTYNGSLGYQQILKEFDLMNGYEFVKLQNEISPSYTQANYFANGKTLESYKDLPSLNWQDKVYRDAVMQNHFISVSGGNSVTRYTLSGSILDQGGIIINSGVKRYQGRITLDQSINPKLKIGLNANYSSIKAYGTAPSLTNSNSSANLMYSIWAYRPVSGRDEDNLEGAIVDPAINTTQDNRWNPVLSAENELRNNITNSMTANVYLEYNLLPKLTFRTTGGITNRMIKAESFNNSRTRSGNPAIGVLGVNGSIIYRPVNSWLNENTLTYKTSYGRHTISALGGFTMQGVKAQEFGSAAIQIPNEALGLSGLDEGVPSRIVSSATSNTLVSFLGRVNYAYGSRYLLTLSLRADGSSKFTSANHWGYFPSGSVAWKMKSEPFMKNIKFISDSKLRLSYGKTGNNRVSDFAYYSTLGFPIEGYYSFDGETPAIGAIPTSLENRNLKWETTSQINLGYDISLFDSRLSLTADLYRKTTSDLLLKAQLPVTSGFDFAFKNVGKVRNEGLEISLNAVIIKRKDFEWNSSFNISFNKSKVLALNEGQESILSQVLWDQRYDPNYLYITKIGHPMTELYGYIWEGNYQVADFDRTPSGTYVLKNNVSDNGSARSTIQPGDIKYRDINGDGTITANDATVIGRSLPVHIGGFTNNFNYKQFDLNVFFQWSYGNDLFNANRLVFEGTSATSVNQYASYIDRWTPENQSNLLYRVNGQGPRGYFYSTRVVEDGSYLRLKTVSLGYNMNSKMLKRINIKSVRWYLSGQNLLTWTKYTGSDPEVSVKSSNLTPGFDYSAYPRVRTITLGLNLTL